jgi:hypothetical protein
MSRPTWAVEISIRLTNGTKGQVQVSADDCLTFREMKQQVLRALEMASQLNAELPAAEEQRPFRIVNN